MVLSNSEFYLIVNGKLTCFTKETVKICGKKYVLVLNNGNGMINGSDYFWKSYIESANKMGRQWFTNVNDPAPYFKFLDDAKVGIFVRNNDGNYLCADCFNVDIDWAQTIQKSVTRET